MQSIGNAWLTVVDTGKRMISEGVFTEQRMPAIMCRPWLKTGKKLEDIMFSYVDSSSIQSIKGRLRTSSLAIPISPFFYDSFALFLNFFRIKNETVLEKLVSDFKRVPFSKDLPVDEGKNEGKNEERKKELFKFFQPEEQTQKLFSPIVSIVNEYDKSVSEEVLKYLDSLYDSETGSLSLTLERVYDIQAIIYPDIIPALSSTLTKNTP